MSDEKVKKPKAASESMKKENAGKVRDKLMFDPDPPGGMPVPSEK